MMSFMSTIPPEEIQAPPTDDGSSLAEAVPVDPVNHSAMLADQLRGLNILRSSMRPMAVLDRLSEIVTEHSKVELTPEHFHALGRIITTWTAGEVIQKGKTLRTLERVPDPVVPSLQKTVALEPPGAVIGISNGKEKGDIPKFMLVSRRPILSSDILGVIGVERYYTPDGTEVLLPPKKKDTSGGPRNYNRAKAPRAIEDIRKDIDLTGLPALNLTLGESEVLQYLGLSYEEAATRAHRALGTVQQMHSKARLNRRISKTQLVAAVVRQGYHDGSWLPRTKPEPVTDLQKEVLRCMLLPNGDAEAWLSSWERPNGETLPVSLNELRNLREQVQTKLGVEDEISAFIIAVRAEII